MNPLLILYLDRYHMEDQIFLQRLARALKARQRSPTRCLIVHGSGEYVERVLEGEGLFPERREGVLHVESPEAIALVERSVRQFNQKIVGICTDEAVACVGIQGMNRNLLWRSEDGAVRARRVGWVEALLQQGVIPVLSALVYDPSDEQVREVRTDATAVAMAQALAAMEPVVVFFTRTDKPGLKGGDDMLAEVAVADLPGEEVLPEAVAVRRVVGANVPVVLSNVAALREAGTPSGTRVMP